MITLLTNYNVGYYALNYFIRAENLSFAHSCESIIKDLSFVVSGGARLTLSGSNGAGKSTCLKLLAGILEPCSGQVSLSIDQSFYNQIAFLGHKDGLHGALDPLKHFDFDLSLFFKSQQTPAQRLAHWGLDNSLQSRVVSQLSAGQRKRAAFALLEAKSAGVWLLDEPHFNLDPQGQALVNEAIASHCKQGGIVILTQHEDPSDGSFINLSATNV